MDTQPKALRLANQLDDEEFNMSTKDIFDAAAELRRLHEVNQSLIASFRMCLDTAYVEHAHDIALSALEIAEEKK